MNDERDDSHSRAAGGAKPSPRLFQKWSRAPHWDPETGVALAFGHDPDEISRVGPHEPPRFASPARERFTQLARSAVESGKLDEEATPSAFLEWAASVGLAFHDNWTSTLNPRVPAGPEGDLEPVWETVTGISKSIYQRDELIENWALAPAWTLQEGACLANNVSPRLLSEYGKLPVRHPKAEKVNRLINFALRAMRQFKLSTDPTPAVFIAWSKTVGFPFDPKWHEVIGDPTIDMRTVLPEAVAPSGAPSSNPVPSSLQSAPAQEPGTRVKETMLKIIIGLAIDAFGYDPRSRRSEVYGIISGELDKLGIPVTAETVRKYLDEGAKLVTDAALDARFRGK